MQTGLKIRELPMVVKKVNDVLKIASFNNNNTSNGAGVIHPAAVDPAPDQLKDDNFLLTYPERMDKETAELIAGLNRTFTVNGLFRLLETIPAEEVTPPVAIHALKRIIHLNNNQARRSLELHVS
jgi:hypothetical protein